MCSIWSYQAAHYTHTKKKKTWLPVFDNTRAANTTQPNMPRCCKDQMTMDVMDMRDQAWRYLCVIFHLTKYSTYNWYINIHIHVVSSHMAKTGPPLFTVASPWKPLHNHVSFMYLLALWVSFCIQLWVFAAQALSNWWCFLNLLVFCPFACFLN